MNKCNSKSIQYQNHSKSTTNSSVAGMLYKRDVSWTHLVADAISWFVWVVGPIHLTAGVSFCDGGLYQLMSQCWRWRAGWQWRGRGRWRGLVVGRLSVSSEKPSTKVVSNQMYMNLMNTICQRNWFNAYRGGTTYKKNTKMYLGGLFRKQIHGYGNGTSLTWSCVLCESPSCCWT